MLLKWSLRIWRELPYWLQLVIARLARPRFGVAVAAIICDQDGQLLLCKHIYRKAYPWGLPAGGLEYREDPQDGIIREVREETGLEVTIERLLLAESAVEGHHISLIYACRVMGGAFQPNIETSQTRYFKINDLPELLPTEKALIDRLGDLGILKMGEESAAG
jgi:8-oxo-dGTP diphosphatase